MRPRATFATLLCNAARVLLWPMNTTPDTPLNMSAPQQELRELLDLLAACGRAPTKLTDGWTDVPFYTSLPGSPSPWPSTGWYAGAPRAWFAAAQAGRVRALLCVCGMSCLGW